MIGSSKGFTFIETLIVTVIISISAAVAIPNFLEAQIRTKVADIQSDLHAIATAEEMYYVDNKSYSLDKDIIIQGQLSDVGSVWLTTPIAYIGEIPTDPFNHRLGKESNEYYQYLNEDTMHMLWHNDGSFASEFPGGYKDAGIGWFAYSYGPDEQDSGLGWMTPSDWKYRCYDSSNGTISSGDVGRCNMGQVPLD